MLVIAASAPRARSRPSSWPAIAREMAAFLWAIGREGAPASGCCPPAAQTRERSTKGGELPSLVMWPGPALDARPLDRGKPRDEDTEGGNQPADKSLINRRLSLRSQLCAAHTFSCRRPFRRAERSTASPPLTANIRDYEQAELLDPHASRSDAKDRVWKDDPVRCLVCASWSVLRGRFAAPQDEVVGSYKVALPH